MTEAPLFYGRPLTEREHETYDALAAMKPGETIVRADGIDVTRANFGPWYYVTNRSDYRCEAGSKIEAAVYVDDLVDAYAVAS